MEYAGAHLFAQSYLDTPEIVLYTERQPRFLPIRITHDNSSTYVLLTASEDSNVIYFFEESIKSNLDSANIEAVSVNDCVIKCQDVLGLKINEIAKLAGVSRASLDLHRKGANIKDMSAYYQLYDFISKVESLYGSTLRNGVRNVLVSRKTIIQHLVNNAQKLDDTFPMLSEVSKKVTEMRVVDTVIDPTKLDLRLGRIGKMA